MQVCNLKKLQYRIDMDIRPQHKDRNQILFADFCPWPVTENFQSLIFVDQSDGKLVNTVKSRLKELFSQKQPDLVSYVKT